MSRPVAGDRPGPDRFGIIQRDAASGLPVTMKKGPRSSRSAGPSGRSADRDRDRQNFLLYSSVSFIVRGAV